MYTLIIPHLVQVLTRTNDHLLNQLYLVDVNDVIRYSTLKVGSPPPLGNVAMVIHKLYFRFQ